MKATTVPGQVDERPIASSRAPLRALFGLAQSAAGAAIALAVLSRAHLQGVEWADSWALFLAIPVLMLPAQRALSGTNRLAVPRTPKRRMSARMLLAWLPAVLRIAGLLLAVIALARPQVSHRDVLVKSDGLDILLALDTSGSMRIEDMPTGSRVANRLSVAKGVAAEFVRGRPNDRVGLIVFGEEAFTDVPLTLDHDLLADVLDSVDIGMAGSRGTAVGTAIAVAARRMKQLKAPERVVILVTDGRSNAGRLGPIEAAEAAAALGIRVYTIGVGQPTTLLGIQLGDGVDDGTLQRVADLTGGKYFRATDMRSLKAVYDTIDELEVSPAQVIEIVEHEERFRVLLLPAFVLLVAQVVLSSTWLRRGP